MELYTAFLLGLVGSLHCAGMCGPLALAMPGAVGKPVSFWAGRAGYNLGRVSAYALLGILFGLAGRTAALAGLQRWLSLVAGVAVLLALAPAWRHGLTLPAIKAVGWLKSGLASLLRQRSLSSLYLLGVLNGFLPCGLVYVACAGALSTGTLRAGAGYMVAFGLGTVPMMFGIGILGRNVQHTVRLRFQRLIPVCMALMGMLLIVRGMGLGIPYLSPDLTPGPGVGHACH
jgi:uncharacterized protein